VGPSGLQLLADDGCAIAPLIRLDEGGADIAIAMFRDALPMMGALRGIFPDIHTHPGDQLAGVGKALDVADFRNHREGKGMLDPFITDQGLHRFRIAFSGGQLLDLLVIARRIVVKPCRWRSKSSRFTLRLPEVALMVRSSQLE